MGLWPRLLGSWWEWVKNRGFRITREVPLLTLVVGGACASAAMPVLLFKPVPIPQNLNCGCLGLCISSGTQHWVPNSVLLFCCS